MHQTGLILLLLITIQLSGICQPSLHQIRGIVKDSATGEVLENTNLSVLRMPDSVRIAKLTSTKKGFLLRQPAGSYVLIASFVNYMNDTLSFRVANEDSLVQLRPLLLQRTATNLVEVIVKMSIPPFVIKSDTLIYRADSYKTIPNATVEDLLKRLPGVRVGRDGTVTVQGKRVEKIYIDGKEFFLNDLKGAIQNLPSGIVDKVEIFDDKSNAIGRTGIANMDAGKALNLTLKAEAKQRPFGKAYASYGNRDRYAAGGTVNSFATNTYLTGMLISNNTSGLFNENGLKNTGNILPGDNQFHHASMDYRTQGKRWTFNSNVIVQKNRVVNESFSQQQIFLTDSSLLTDRQSVTDDNNKSQSGDITLEYQVDSTTSLRFNGHLSAIQSNSRNSTTLSTRVLHNNNQDYLLNNSVANNGRETSSFSGYYILSVRKQFSKKGRFLEIMVNQGFRNSNNTTDLYSLTTFAPDDSLLRNQASKEKSGGNNYRINLSYVEPVSKHASLDFRYNIGVSPNASRRMTHDYNPVSGKYDILNTIASNSFESKNTSQLWSAGYNYARNKINYQLGLGMQQLLQKNNDLTGNIPAIEERQTNIFPQAVLLYKFSRTKNLNISYYGNSLQPTIRQLQPVPDYSNPLLVQLGNPNLRQQFTHSILANLNLVQPQQARSLLIGAEAKTITRQIVSSTVINAQGIQEQQFVNVGGNYSVSGNMGYGFMLGKKQHGNGQLNTRLSYGNETSLLNGVENTRRSFSLSQSVNLNYNFKEKLFTEFSAGAELGKASYSLSKERSTTYVNHFYSANLSYVLPAAFYLATTYNLSVSGSQGSLPGNTLSLLNAAISKKFLKKQAAELRFSIFDLLNQNRNFNRVIGDNYIEVSGGNVLKRFFQVSFIYHFNPPGIQ